jgi:hypothetical protein
VNFNLVVVITFMAGAVLLYSAIKDKNPKDVISDALNGKSAPSAASNISAASGGIAKVPGAGDPGTIITGV